MFPSIWDREMAEKQLDCSKYKGGKVVVNWNRNMVPMAEGDLDRSRQITCLAVHGISAGTSKRDLETVFPGSVSVTIARGQNYSAAELGLQLAAAAGMPTPRENGIYSAELGLRVGSELGLK